MSELIILANSWKKGGRCVAGIDPNTGEWKRPIPNTKDRTIPDTSIITNLNLLDIVDVSFTGKKPKPTDKYQIENEFVKDYKWKTMGSLTVAKVKKYCKNTGLILHSDNDHVDPTVLDSLPESKWKSLQLVESDAVFIRHQYEQKTWWRVEFNDSLGNHLDIKLTDPVANEKLNKGNNLDGKCLLTISLGQPWQPKDKSKALLCYKLVAGVIKL